MPLPPVSVLEDPFIRRRDSCRPFSPARAPPLRAREFYPQESPGEVDLVGSGPGAGYTVNLAWAGEAASATDGDMLSGFMHVVMPLAYSFSPDLILVSAGFGAADKDFQGEEAEGEMRKGGEGRV
jgi:hypothetical protein